MSACKQFDAEFRRFSMVKSEVAGFSAFYQRLQAFHKLNEIEFLIFYTDPSHGDLLPINNDENLAKAISSAKPFLRLILQRKGEDRPLYSHTRFVSSI